MNILRLITSPCCTLCIVLMLAMSAHGAGTTSTSARSGSEIRATNADETIGHPTFVSPHAFPIAIHEQKVFVVNTPSDTIDVINRSTRSIVRRIPVGVDPVSVAVRPDGLEVWASNHISDSVSVIDNAPDSPTYLSVIDTIQQFDSTSQSTRFDEPMAIAFAGNDKAYVALSSENQIAVIDTTTRKITKRLRITAQDPRAVFVRNDRLYVIPFESGNKTQLSGGSAEDIDGKLVTFDAWDHSVVNNNVLSLGHVTDIVKHPEVPDRDLYVFDTKTDRLVKVVDSLGTLLYGLTVDSSGRVFIAQTDARNDANGRSGTQKHGLAELENRAFLNQITSVYIEDNGDIDRRTIDLEPLPPQHPSKDDALATPFAIQISNDDSTLIATAAGSDKLFTIDAATGEILGRVTVGAVPRGIALEPTKTDAESRAWVFNAVANTVSVVDIADRHEPAVVDTIELDDPTEAAIKRGRIAFNTASASSTGTYSCASCHPDGHTDQLLWVLKTPIVTGGDQIMPRSTMPIRGIRDTEPYHWDGIPGDPYGGNNSANVHGSDPPNCTLGNPVSSARHLIDGGLAATMKMVEDDAVNEEGKAGYLTAEQRDDMAAFILSVPYPPAQRRAFTNKVSSRAEHGFELFHITGHLDGKPRPNLCGNCHRMPFLVSTNTRGTGMDAPTWRGAYDRPLILPQGRLNIIEFDFYRRIAEKGVPERQMWQFSWQGQRRFDPVWDMVLEGSTGYSGAFARQITINQRTATEQQTANLLEALEQADREESIVLLGQGVLVRNNNAESVNLNFESDLNGGHYVSKSEGFEKLDRKMLLTLAADGSFIGTLTAHHGSRTGFDHPQPALWTEGPIEQQRGRQKFPILHSSQKTMKVSGRHIDQTARIHVDGRRVSGTIELGQNETLNIALDSLPATGLHLIQVQNPSGMFSNDFIFHVADDEADAIALQRRIDLEHQNQSEALLAAIRRGNIDEVRYYVENGAPLNKPAGDSGSTPLNMAAVYGNVQIARFLIETGADIKSRNRDGNTAILIAAFFCHEDFVEFMLKHDADPLVKNDRGENAIDVVSGEWTTDLAGLYQFFGEVTEQDLDLKHVERTRPAIRARLTNYIQQEKEEQDNVRFEGARELLRNSVESGKVAGIAHLVVQNGKEIHFESAGVRDIESRKPFTDDTLLRIYSMTKPITSVAAMTLYEQDKFRLDDPVSKYIPAFANTNVLQQSDDETKIVPAIRQITVRDVFRHTTGFSYGNGTPNPIQHYQREGMRYRSPAGMYPPEMTIEEAAEALARIPAIHHPGERFTYGFNTDLLGRLIEVWSGKSLDQYLKTAILEPLEMRDTAFEVPETARDSFASCHTIRDGKLAIVDKASDSEFNDGFSFLSGGGGLVSTIRDYSNFCQMMVDGGKFKDRRILSEETVRMMFSNQLTEVPGDFQFGLGFAIDRVQFGEADSQQRVAQYSWGGYASTDFRLVPEKKLFQIVMRQHVPSSHELARKLFASVYESLND